MGVLRMTDVHSFMITLATRKLKTTLRSDFCFFTIFLVFFWTPGSCNSMSNIQLKEGEVTATIYGMVSSSAVSL